MTEEEIRPIAENYVEEYCHCSDGEYTDGDLVCTGIGTALIVSRQLEKRIAELENENTELKNRDCWKSCEYENPKAELIEQHIKDVQNLTKAKELLKWFVWYFREGSPNLVPYKHKVEEAEQFLNSEVEK